MSKALIEAQKRYKAKNLDKHRNYQRDYQRVIYRNVYDERGGREYKQRYYLLTKALVENRMILFNGVY